MTSGVAKLPFAANKFRKRSSLTERDIKILEMAAAGSGEKEMTAELLLSIHNLKKIRKELLQKMGAENMLQAVAQGIRRGIIE